MSGRRLRVCFAQAISNDYRYQRWLYSLLKDFTKYAVRYNDFGPRIWSGGMFAQLMTKFALLSSFIREVPSIVWCDVVIFSELNAFHPLFLLAVILRKYIVLDVYISRYQTIVESRGQIKEDTRKARSLWREERSRFSKANALVFLTNEEVRLYCDILDVNPINCIVLPLGNEDKPDAVLPYFTGARKRPHIYWWGGENNPLHGLQTIVAGLKMLEMRGYSFEFTILGSNPIEGDSYYGKLLGNVGWEDSVQVHYFWGSSLFEETLSSDCDLGFGALSSETKAISVITNKALDCANMGIPLVTVRCNPMEAYFDDSCVWYVDDPTPESVCETVAAVLDNPLLAIQKAERAQEIFDRTFSMLAYERRFKEMWSAICSEVK